VIIYCWIVEGVIDYVPFTILGGYGPHDHLFNLPNILLVDIILLRCSDLLLGGLDDPKPLGNCPRTLLCPHCANFTRVTVHSPSPRARYPNRSCQRRGSACKSARPLVVAVQSVVAAGEKGDGSEGLAGGDVGEGDGMRHLS